MVDNSFSDFQFGNPTKTLQQAQLYIDPLSVCANYYRDSIWVSDCTFLRF